MSLSKTAAILAISSCLPLVTSLAHADNWVDTGHDVLIDVDSIRKDADGLTYYAEKTKTYDEDDNRVWTKARKAAYDCRKGLAYSSYSLEYEPDWRAKGAKMKPGTMGGVLLDFVCSRVP